MMYFVIAMVLGVFSYTSGTQSRMFKKSTRCPDQILNPSLHFDAQSVRGSLECTVRCGTHPGCVSAEYDSINKLCYLSDHKAQPDCSNMETAPRLQRFETALACKNGGADLNGTCSCPDLYCGTFCEHRVQDCQDWAHCKGQFLNPAVVRAVWPDTAPAPFHVLCFELVNNPQVQTFFFKRQSDSTVSFSRTWEDYRNGFGNLAQDHWLGLDKLHWMTTNRNYTLRVSLMLTSGQWFTATYSGFVLNGRPSGYSFSARSLEPTALLDCLSPLEGVRFSTYDNDNDGTASVNCAQRHGAGFWFKGDNCSTVCNPFGSPMSPADGEWSGAPDEAFWMLDRKYLGPDKVKVVVLNEN